MLAVLASPETHINPSERRNDRGGYGFWPLCQHDLDLL